MQKIMDLLARLHMRVTAAVLAIIVLGLVWLVTRLFPSVNPKTAALIGAFLIAALFAFTIGGRRRT